MARKRDNTSSDISLDSLLSGPPEVSPSTFDLVRLMALQEIQDARQWQPDPLQTPRTFQGTPSKISMGDVRRGYHSARDKLSFVNKPFNPVIHCVRRKVRREVLFAFNKTRKGAGGRKHRNRWSDVKC